MESENKSQVNANRHIKYTSFDKPCVTWIASSRQRELTVLDEWEYINQQPWTIWSLLFGDEKSKTLRH